MAIPAPRYLEIRKLHIRLSEGIRMRRFFLMSVRWAALVLIPAVGLSPSTAAEGTETGPAIAAKDLLNPYKAPVLPPPIVKATVLAKLEGKHPRILLPQGGLPEYLKRAKGTHRHIAAEIRELADLILGKGIEKQPKNAEGPMRRALRKPGLLAWAYAATGDVKYRDAAIRWTLACCRYPHWDIDVDLAAGHALVAISQVYDWFYETLTPEQRRIIRDKVALQGKRMALVWGKKKVKGGTWWTRSFLQNHGMINSAGLFIAGLAFHGEIPDAEVWIDLAEKHFDKVFSIVNEDGSNMEGINYWGYGTEHLLLYAEAARSVLGRDYFKSSGYLRNTGRFFLAHTTPWLRFGDHAVPYASPGLSAGTHGPSHILWCIAGSAGDGLMQHMGDLAWRKKLNAWSPMRAYALLWYEPEIKATPPESKATDFAFADLGIATARSSWKEDATLLWFKCGPFQGRAATKVFNKNVCSPHGRPDQSVFQIISRGERLTAYGNHLCANQSMILIRGHGQVGESPRGLMGRALIGLKQAQLLRADSTREYAYFAGDVGDVYRKEAGLKQLRRHVIYLKPDDVLVVDDVLLGEAPKKATKPAKGENGKAAADVVWQLQAAHPARKVAPRHFVVSAKKGALDVMSCLPEEVTMDAPGPRDNRGYMVAKVFQTIHPIRIQVRPKSKRPILVTYLHCRTPKDQPATRPEVQREADLLTVRVDVAGKKRSVTVDLDKSVCTVR